MKIAGDAMHVRTSTRGRLVRSKAGQLAAIVLATTLVGLTPATAAAASPIAMDDPGTQCGNLANFGGAFPVPEDFIGPFTGVQAGWFLVIPPCDLLSNDTDPDGDPLTIDILTQPAHGQVMLVTPQWYVYKPEPNFSTIAGNQSGGQWVSDSFTYRAFDGTSYSNAATMKFWVSPVNDPPSFTPGPTVVINEDSGTYSAPWATNVSAGPPNESDQTVSFPFTISGVSHGSGPLFTDISIDSTGRLSFTPAPNDYGIAHVTVYAKDDGGTENYGLSPGTMVPPDDTSDPVTFDIVVNAVDDPVVAVDDEIPTFEDTDTILHVRSNDTNIDNVPFVITGVTQPAHGTTSISPDGWDVFYTPTHDFNGQDSFTYTITGGSTATVTVAVAPVEDPPVAVDDGGFVVPPGSGPTTLDVLANDLDVDGDALAVVAVAAAGHGTTAISGAGTSVTYDPVDGYSGPDAFTYTIGDGHGGTDSATVQIDVSDDVSPPVAGPLSQSLPGQTVGSNSVKVDLAWSWSDPGSGIASQQLQMSVDGAAYANVVTSSSTRTFERALTIGRTYRFRIRATDHAGNASTFVSWPSLTPGRHEETSSLATYTGTWSRSSNSKMSGGGSKYATGASGRITFSFSGRDVGWIATRTPSGGRARVLIDGVLVATIDLGTTANQFRKLVFRHAFASAGRHTVVIQPVGDGRVDIDGFIVLR
jgi:Bacterial Ig domain